MPAVTIRNLPAETHRALKQRASRNSRSTEAEIRMILEEAVRPEARVRIGSALAAFGRKHGGIELEALRDRTPAGGTMFD
jgi:antitoxin FitA